MVSLVVRSTPLLLTGFELTKSRVEHVKRHSVTLLCARDRDQTLIAIVLRLVDLDNTTADLADLVDLLATLTNDGSDHIVRNEDLLSQWSTGHTSASSASSATMHRRSMRSSMVLGTRSMSRLVRRHVRCSSTIASGLGSIVHGDTGTGLGSSSVRMILLGIRVGRHLMRAGIRTPSVILTVAEVAAGRLRSIRDHLHSTRDDSSRAATPRGIGRSRRTAESFVELLEQGAANIVSCDMNSISHTHHHKGAFTRKGQAGIRGIQASARSLLDLTDANTALADDGPDKDMRDEQAKGIGLGLCTGGLGQGLIVQSTDNQTKGLSEMLAAS